MTEKDICEAFVEIDDANLQLVGGGQGSPDDPDGLPRGGMIDPNGRA